MFKEPTAPSPGTYHGLLVEAIEREIIASFPDLQTLDGKEHVVLLVGNTKSGKSALLNYLMESRIEVVRKWGRITAKLADGEFEYAKIGETANSETSSPKAFEKDDWVYCDTPGFSDTRVKEKAICSMATMHAGIKMISSIQSIVIVVDAKAFINDAVGTELRELVFNVARFINLTNKEKIQPHLIFAFTKVDGKLTREEIVGKIEQLKTAQSKKFMELQQNIQRQLAAGVSEKELGERKAELLDIGSKIAIFDLIQLNNMVLLNVFDGGESRVNLIDKLKENCQLPAIPKEMFISPNEHSVDWNKFREAMFTVAHERKNLLVRKMELDSLKNMNYRELEQLKIRIEGLETHIREVLKAGKNIVEKITVKYEDENQAEETALRKEIKQIKIEYAALQEKMNLLNTDDDAFHPSELSIEPVSEVERDIIKELEEGSAFGFIMVTFPLDIALRISLFIKSIIYKTQSIEINLDIPYKRFEHRCWGGELHIKKNDPNTGYFSASFTRFENSDNATIRFIVKKKDLKDNKLLISDYQKKIVEKKHRISVLQQELDKLIGYKTIMDDLQRYTQELADRNAKYQELKQNFPMLEQQIESVTQELQVTLPALQVAYRVSVIFEHFHSPLMLEFSDAWIKYLNFYSANPEDSVSPPLPMALTPT